MLIELQQLSSSLVNLGLSMPEIHPWVKPLNSGPFVVASLDTNGTVRKADLREAGEKSGIRKVQKDNQNAFPTFKLACPLFKVATDDPMRRILGIKHARDVERAKNLTEFCSKAELATTTEKNKKRLAQFVKFARELRFVFDPLLSENPAVQRLLSSLETNVIEVGPLLRNLTECITAAVAQGDSFKLAEQILIGAVKKSGQVDETEVPIVFDVYRTAQEDFAPITHRKTEIFYHHALLRREQGDADGTCVLTGEAQLLERGNFPSPRLPALSDTILFSANQDIPCLTRYSLTSSEMFPVGKRTVQALNSAILWITAEQRKKKTWSLVPRSDDTGRDLVIAYIEAQPDLDADLTELLSDLQGEQTEIEGIFEAKAQSVIKAFDELRGRLATDAILHTLVLRRISKGQVQVELSRQYKVERIREALIKWQGAANNIPLVKIFVPTGKGKAAKLISPRIPYPGQILEATKWHWIRGGSERQGTTGCSLATVYDLYLGESPIAKSAARAMLAIVIPRCTPLLLLAGDQFSRHGRSVLDMPVPARYSAVEIVNLLGISLYKLGRMKESYMNDTAFLLGRMLALSDLLHAQYCRVVRGGNLPPQLLGNQHYSIASDRPVRACAVLGERLRIYKAWADTARRDAQNESSLQNAVKTAKWAVNEMSLIAPVLHSKLPERGFDEQGKAEMLLGYLSSEAEREKND